MYDIIPVDTYNSIQIRNKSADQITHFLKLFGNGNMNLGLKRVASISYDLGEKHGIIEGVGSTLSGIAVLCLIKFMVEKKKEGQSLKTKKRTSLKDTDNTSDGTNIDSKSDTHRLGSHKNVRNAIDG